MPRIPSLLVVAVVLGGCAQVDAAPPSSLADQLAVSPRDTPSTTEAAD